MRYKYQAVDEQGQEVSGILTADAEREAARQLQRRGLMVLSLSTKNEKVKAKSTKKATQRDILIVLHELATLLESDISLIESVESLAKSSHHAFITETFSDISAQLRRGTAFSVALKASPLKLPWYVTQLIESGELTGKVGTALRDGVNQMEYDDKVRSEMRNAMIYPSILIFSGISAVLLIFIIVVPRFANMLKTRGDDIPMLSKIVLNMGMFFNTHVEWLLGGFGIILIILIYIFNQPKLLVKFKNFTATLPLIGTWIIESETGRWASMMATLLENRVSLLRALELASQGIKLPMLNIRLTQVAKDVRAGVPLSEALEDNEALNSTGHNLILAGEKAGKLPKMLRSLSKLLGESGRTRMKRFLLLIEPIAILTIGAVIGVIITGIILAITSVNEIKF